MYRSGDKDFVSKPVELEDLRRALENVPARHYYQASQTVKRSEEDWTIPESVEHILNENRAIAESIFEMFTSNMVQRFHLLRQRVAEGDVKSTLNLLHGMKGSSRQIGAARMSRNAEALEQQVGQRGLLQIGQQLDELERNFQTARDLIGMRVGDSQST